MIKNWEQYLPSFIRRQFEGRKNLKKITENIGWLFFDKILRMGMGLVVGVWVARYLGPELFGTWNYALAFSALFGTFATLGLDGIAVRELVKTPEKENEILSSAFILCLAGGVFAFLASGAAISILKPQDTLTFWLVVIASAGFIFQSFMVIDYHNQAKLRSKNTVIAMNSAFIVNSAVRVGFILFKAPLMAFAIAGLAEIALGTALMLIFYFKKNKKFIFTPYLVQIKTLLKDSWPLILSGLAIMVYMKIDQIMIGEMLGETAVGLYSAAVKISEVWYFIPIVITSSLFPSIVEAKKQDEKLYYKRLQQLYSLMILISAAIALPMTFLSDWVIRFLYGDAYLLAASVLSIHIWAGIFVFLGVASGQWLLIENLQKIALKRTLFGVISNIILNFFLIQKLSIFGAALATLISQSIAAFFYDFFDQSTKKIFFLKLKAFLIWRI